MGLAATFQRFRARIDGLSDDEYFWEPVPDCWSVREQDGIFRVDGGPTPTGQAAPVTTISWRLVHIASDVLLGFAHREWPDRVPDPRDLPVPSTAAAAIELCELGERSWRENFESLGDDGIRKESRALKGGRWASDVAGLHVHVYDEFIHHAAEVGLLRDLYRATFG